jgi:Tol biopolymer transport system component
MKRHIHPLLIALVFVAGLLAPMAASSQSIDPSLLIYPYNHLKWYTLESDHFQVHFQEGNDRTARVVIRIAEEVYGPITELYRLEPETKVSIVLKDREDYSNGAAYFFDNKIDIWVPALDSPLRGTNNWLRNVITHEFVHIVQIQASMKRSRRIPGIYLQWLGYENVRRPDVLYGYPNAIITYPIFSMNVPAWFAEGTAQFMRSDLRYDTWDSHRDMIMRTRVLNGTALSLDQMGTFSNKIAIEREVTYNSGFAFTRYLADRFGEDVLFEISHALSRKDVHTITNAIGNVTGTNGYQIYDEWIESLRVDYQSGMQGVRIDANELIEGDGFVNYYATPHPDGKRLFYLSNRGRDTYRASLYVTDMEGSDKKLVYEPDVTGADHVHTLSCGHSFEFKLRPDNSAFSISPDGNSLVFSQIRLNKFGETYRDLHIMDLSNTKKVRRITNDARLHEPAYSPDGKQIVAVYTNDGTQNIVLVDPETGDTTPLTNHSLGERVYRPLFSPDAAWIYFSYADLGHRSIRRINVQTKQIEKLLENGQVDFRDQFLSDDGSTLFYAADHDGIFNIWKLDLDSKVETQLTSVLGGAFMPAVTNDNILLYSEYKWDGYKLAKISLSDVKDPVAQAYRKPLYSFDVEDSIESISKLNAFDDRTIPFVTDVEWAGVDTSTVSIIDADLRDQSGNLELKKYDDVFTSFSFYPTIRFDNYSKLNGTNTSLINQGRWGKLGGNLWRDFKAGVYLTSRDVTDKFTIFGGALLGLGSLKSDGAGDFISPNRLVKLDRDMFLQVDYNGLPFIKRHWSPTVSLELTSIRRNVNNGLSIEEFPCISCLPDTSYADIAYDIFEAAIYFRSKLRSYDYVELGASYSPYRVATSSFISKEYQSEIAGSSSRYYIGSRFTAAYVVRMDLPYQHSDIAPIGLRGWFRYNYEPSRLLEKYSIENGQLNPEYQSNQNHSVELFARYGFMVKKQSFQVNLAGLAQLSTPGDDFFLNYYGGITGMRSYPFFALGGYRTIHSTVSWNIPMWKRIDKQLNRFTIDKVYTRVFTEVGNGWGNPMSNDEKLKTGIGAELRVGLVSNYMLPTRFFVSAAYGFNNITVNLPEQFITPTGATSVKYGREILLHFGLLFDFEM